MGSVRVSRTAKSCETETAWKFESGVGWRTQSWSVRIRGVALPLLAHLEPLPLHSLIINRLLEHELRQNLREQAVY